jgi:hypothetical protein
MGGFADFGTNQTHVYQAAGWQLGFNAGVSYGVGFFTGGFDSFTGPAVEWQASLGPLSFSALFTRDSAGNRQFGIFGGFSELGYPLGMSVGRTYTRERITQDRVSSTACVAASAPTNIGTPARS